MTEPRFSMYSYPATQVAEPPAREVRVTTAQHLAWARLLQYKRKLLGLSVADMVERTGCSDPTIRSYERQFSPGMKMGTFMRVLQAYEIETHEAAAALGMRVDEMMPNTPTKRRIHALMDALEQTVDEPHADHILSVFEEFLRGYRRTGQAPA